MASMQQNASAGGVSDKALAHLYEIAEYIQNIQRILLLLQNKNAIPEQQRAIATASQALVEWQKGHWLALRKAFE